MIPEIVQLALVIALLLAIARTVFPLVGAHRGWPSWMATARPAAQGYFVFVALAYGCLTASFLGNDFSVLYVASNSNSLLPAYYRFAAVWGGHEGSMPLWVLILSLWMVAVSVFSRNLPEAMAARVLGVMGLIGAGLILFILTTSNPFDRLLPAAVEGRDLNPLLQDPGMILHPPLLYMGYVGFSVAFAFAIAALLAGNLDAAWARWSRPWTMLSREAMLLMNNVFLMAALGSVLLGTLYPLLLDALGMNKISVGPPYFNSVFIPLMAPVLFLMGVGPLARWKQASGPDLVVRLRWAFLVSLLTALVLPFVLGSWQSLVGLGLFLALWIASTSFLNLHDRLKQPGAPLSTRLRRVPFGFYGMVLAHCGVAVFVVGVTLVKGYETERDVRMKFGDTVSIAGYAFRFDGLKEVEGPNYAALRGSFQVSRDGKPLTVLHPEKRVYRASRMPMTEAAIDLGLTRDLYVALGEPLSEDTWVVRVYHKPFVGWIWAGFALMALGGFLAVSDRRYRLHAHRAGAGLPAASAVAGT